MLLVVFCYYLNKFLLEISLTSQALQMLVVCVCVCVHLHTAPHYKSVGVFSCCVWENTMWLMSSSPLHEGNLSWCMWVTLSRLTLTLCVWHVSASSPNPPMGLYSDLIFCLHELYFPQPFPWLFNSLIHTRLGLKNKQYHYFFFLISYKKMNVIIAC